MVNKNKITGKQRNTETTIMIATNETTILKQNNSLLIVKLGSVVDLSSNVFMLSMWDWFVFKLCFLKKNNFLLALVSQKHYLTKNSQNFACKKKIKD